MELEKNKLDQWLDQALNEYGHAEPRLGLESRIFAHLAAEKSSTARRTLWPRALASVAAVLTVVVVIWAWMSTQKSHRPSINFANNDTVILHKQPMVSTKSTVQVRRPTTIKRGVRQQLAKAPRLSQFPSVRELSTQEELLVRYAHEFPQKALETAQEQALAEQERINSELAAE
jgi:hypothetical protein